jgi:hypothetical protein
MVQRRKPPSQKWRTFLENHAKDIVSVDFFTVPIATFRVLFVFLMLCNDRRRVVHFNVTAVAQVLFPLRPRIPDTHRAGEGLPGVEAGRAARPGAGP